MVALDGEVLPSVRVRVHKTGAYVERCLHAACRAAIRRYMNWRADQPWHDVSPYLFRPEGGMGHRKSKKPLNRGSVWRIYKSYLERMFSPAVTIGQGCHVTRRSVAKIVATQAEDGIVAAAKFLGHDEGNLASVIAYLDMDQAQRRADDAVRAVFDRLPALGAMPESSPEDAISTEIGRIRRQERHDRRIRRLAAVAEKRRVLRAMAESSPAAAAKLDAERRSWRESVQEKSS